MRELVKAALALSIAAAVGLSVWAWLASGERVDTWVGRLSGPTLVLFGLYYFAKIFFPQDRAPDFLREEFGKYFDRGGFCFVVRAEGIGGVCFLSVYFQNRFEKPCIGRVAVRPAKGPWGRRPLDWVRAEIPCEGGAFGVARIPVGLPALAQGKRRVFELAAAVTYPHRPGRQLRFRPGVRIPRDTIVETAEEPADEETAPVQPAMKVSAIRKTRIKLPAGVYEELPIGTKRKMETLWRVGDAYDS